MGGKSLKQGARKLGGTENEPQEELLVGLMLLLCYWGYRKEGLKHSPPVTTVKEVGSPGSRLLHGN